MTESTERGGGRNETKEIRTTTPIALETDEGWEEWAERRETSKNAAKGGKAGIASLAIPAALAIGNVAAATRWGRGKKDEEEGREGKEKEEENRNGKKKRRRRWGKPQPSEGGAPCSTEGGAGQYATDRGGSAPPLSNARMGGWMGSSGDPSHPVGEGGPIVQLDSAIRQQRREDGGIAGKRRRTSLRQGPTEKGRHRRELKRKGTLRRRRRRRREAEKSTVKEGTET